MRVSTPKKWSRRSGTSKPASAFRSERLRLAIAVYLRQDFLKLAALAGRSPIHKGQPAPDLPPA